MLLATAENALFGKMVPFSANVREDTWTEFTEFGNGTMGLAGGNVDERYAYYRDSAFQQFLDKFGITRVVYANPNRTFVGIKDYNEKVGTKVLSDGKVRVRAVDSSLDEHHIVTGATWAFVECHNNSKTLYCQKNINNILDLEEALKKAINNER